MNNCISVLIPTYNEKETILGIIDTLLNEIKSLNEIIVIDDNSPDLTWQLVEQINKENNKISLIRRLDKKGLPGAIWEGIINSRGSIILWLDADFLSLPSTITGLVNYLGEADIVVASRYVESGKDNRKEAFRVLLSRLFNECARFILGVKTRDLTSGYILARKEVFDKIKITGLYGEYCVRFLYQAEKNNFKIKEFPYVCLSREKGNSKTSSSIATFIRYGLIYIHTVLNLRFFGK